MMLTEVGGVVWYVEDESWNAVISGSRDQYMRGLQCVGVDAGTEKHK